MKIEEDIKFKEIFKPKKELDETFQSYCQFCKRETNQLRKRGMNLCQRCKKLNKGGKRR